MRCKDKQSLDVLLVTDLINTVNSFFNISISPLSREVNRLFKWFSSVFVPLFIFSKMICAMLLLSFDINFV